MSFEDLLHPLLDRYLQAPDWVKASAGRAYAWVPARLRFGGAYYRFRDEVAVRDAGALDRLARRKLRSTLEWALQTVPAYRDYAPLLARCDDTGELLARVPRRPTSSWSISISLVRTWRAEAPFCQSTMFSLSMRRMSSSPF